MKLQKIDSIEEVRRTWPVMRELRDHLNETTYLELFQTARNESGYTLIGAYKDNDCVGLMGYRILTDFVHGKHVYVDDLVTTSSCRSQGIGQLFLDKAKEIARENGCGRLRLCTGIQNDAGKKFYERNGWALRAVVYKASV